jgi:pyridoxal biosynthesis lyase PdxS
VAGRAPRRRATAASRPAPRAAALTRPSPAGSQARIGHFVEAQILEAIGIDFIDESEVLTPADETHHINKHNFKVPVLCGCRNLGEALRRIAEVRGTAR